jgi:hypothetical protein
VDSKRLDHVRISGNSATFLGDLSFGFGDALNLFNREACPLAAGRLRKAKSSSQKNGSGAGVRFKKGNIELRLWLSGPRIGWFRHGISLGREDVHPRLPSWRRYEYREALKAYATKHGQPITDAQADHDIDKAVALGELDAEGPVLHVEGTREELVATVMQTGEKFGIPMDRAEAERLADKALRRRFPWPAIVLAALLLGIIVALAH